MQTQYKSILTIVSILFISILNAQILDVHISNIRNKKGQLCLAVFKDEEAFKKEKTSWALNCSKKDVINGEFNIQIPFQEGIFGFSVLDDENSTGKMEYNMFGIPREGFGFSNYYHKGLLKPHFDAFSFSVKKK